jgi:hypothetical protein
LFGDVEGRKKRKLKEICLMIIARFEVPTFVLLEIKVIVDIAPCLLESRW